jgi:hypothetical protein
MVSVFLVCLALLSPGSLAAEGAKASPADRAAYEAAKTKVGRDPDAQVKLALWCEAHGLSTERVKHLALAVLSNPAHATARGLLGLVPFQGQWKTPDAIKARLHDDEAYNAAMAEYAARRQHLQNTADSHWKMALWCEEKGLKPEAKAHLAIVLELDPSREAAWKRLGFKKHKNRWVTDAGLAAEKAEAEAQKAADKHWKPLLARWRSWLSEKDQAKRAEAAKGLGALTDPRAVPSVWLTFAGGTTAAQTIAVQVLGQIDSPGSTRALAVLAVHSESPEIRGKATATLERRDPRDFVGFLIGLLRDPVKYQVKPVGGPGSPGALFVNGKQFNVQRLYEPPPMPNIPIYPGERVTYDAYGLPVISRFLGMGKAEVDSQVTQVTVAQFFGMAPVDQGRGHLIQLAHENPENKALSRGGAAVARRDSLTGAVSLTATTSATAESNLTIPIGQIMLEYQKSAIAAQEQLAGDVRAVESYNATVKESNQRVLQVLSATTSQSLGEKRENWNAWWTDFQGYSYTPPPDVPKPTVIQNVPLAYSPQPVMVSTQSYETGPETTSVTAGVHHSCFQAGTPVRTLAGLRAIETIRAGDQVLAQDPANGKLSFQPVLAVYHNKPIQLLRINLDDEMIGATPIHRFWKAGKGWIMARNLAPGDLVRSMRGIDRVRSVEKGPIQPVFNLKVADCQSFLVGKAGILVHDNSLVQPVLKPFDTAPELAAVAPEGR